MTEARGEFVTTHWSVVLQAARAPKEFPEAVERFCETYWFPVYAFVRRNGSDSERARELTQEFFLRVLERQTLRQVDPSRGRFRSFLLASVRNFLLNERRNEQALKRGGRRLEIDIDAAETRYRLEGQAELSPDKLFDRQWALLVLDRALTRLRDQYAAAGKLAVFEQLKSFLTGAGGAPSYAAVARTIGCSEGALKVSIHRLRRQFREVLIAEIEPTVADPAEIAGEIRYLIEAVAGRDGGV